MTLDLPHLVDITDATLTATLHQTLNNKTKPLGSLGRIEDLALQIGQILGTDRPVLEQPQMVVFAGDHGLATDLADPSQRDTTTMVDDILQSRVALPVLAIVPKVRMLAAPTPLPSPAPAPVRWDRPGCRRGR